MLFPPSPVSAHHAALIDYLKTESIAVKDPSLSGEIMWSGLESHHDPKRNPIGIVHLPGIRWRAIASLEPEKELNLTFEVRLIVSYPSTDADARFKIDDAAAWLNSILAKLRRDGITGTYREIPLKRAFSGCEFPDARIYLDKDQDGGFCGATIATTVEISIDI